MTQNRTKTPKLKLSKRTTPENQFVILADDFTERALLYTAPCHAQYPETIQQHKELAEKAVRACNSHDALVEALERMKECYMNGYFDDEAIGEAIAALALAKGE